ncbi:MAG: TetR family transcriptional regulator [Erysipelotrichaceae bacterium]|nr:TetR family transcriptional regulator [Erysipelotrichaceae bacterium]
MKKQQINAMAARSQHAIGRAFLSLIETYAYEDISVTAICEKAGVVRKTFYNNFTTKDDVVHYLIQEIFIELERELDLLSMSLEHILLYIFEFVEKNQEALLLFYQKGLFRFAYKSIATCITQDHILAMLNKEGIDFRALKYILAQIPAVLISVIEVWIENDFEEPITFLVDLVIAMMYKPLIKTSSKNNIEIQQTKANKNNLN